MKKYFGTFFSLVKKYIPAIKNHIPTICIVLFAGVFLVSAGILVNYFIDSTKNKNQFSELADLVQQAQQELGNSGDATTPPKSVYTEIIHPDTGEKMQILYDYAKLFQMNTDLVGWIRINGTDVNYPVMQTPNRENYYLKRDFYKKDSRFGCIYAKENADLHTPSDNVTLYGHNMNDGSMLASLHKYSDKSFYDANPYITFDTIFEHHIYQIISVFYTSDLYMYPSTPSETTADPTDATTNPTVGATDPTVGATDPTVGATDPTVGATDPTVGATDPTVDATDPTVGATDPTVGATDPTVGATDPTVGATDPTVGATDPTVGATDPTEAITNSSNTGFPYHLFVNGNKLEFADFVAQCKALSLYDTGVTATYGDKLLTLSTCDKDYSDDHGRFVVVAKRIA